jgi:hypothetical protein
MPFADSNQAKIHYALEGQPAKRALILSNSLGADFSMSDPQMPGFLQSLRVPARVNDFETGAHEI